MENPQVQTALQLYKGSVMHSRTYPKKHRFVFPLFMFFLNLDKMENTPWLWGHNRIGLFRFNDDDFLPSENSALIEKKKKAREKKKLVEIKPLKEKVIEELKKYNPSIARKVRSVYLLAHHRMWGYLFNPASFYFCFSAGGKPLAALTEVTNTFKERKVYFIPFSSDKKAGKGVKFIASHAKLFYISPFSPLNTILKFHFAMPGDTIHLQVNEFFAKEHFAVTAENLVFNETRTKNCNNDSITRGKIRNFTIRAKNDVTSSVENSSNKPFFYSLFKGKRQACASNLSLLKIALQYPFATLNVILLIHWHACLLWLKKIPFYHKEKNLELQNDIFFTPKKSKIKKVSQ